MSAEAELIDDSSHKYGYVGRIPLRNLWLLMFYASDLFRHLNVLKISIEENPEDIPDLVAEILIALVDRRLMRNLSFGYQSREAVISRVRGHINLLYTEGHQLLDRGKIACRFDELTVNTPRNCYVRSALEKIAYIVKRPELAHRCRSLSGSLKRKGVIGEKPGRSKISTDRPGKHNSGDNQMLAAAHLAFDLALPTEEKGTKSLLSPEREITWIRHLYEKGIAGFYDVVLRKKGWQVYSGKAMFWQIENKTSGIDSILPSMRTDIVLDHDETKKRIVIDTKFTDILTKGWYREATLRSGYIYQIYTYLRSQETNNDFMSMNASGLLLHPSIDKTVDETVLIQGHQIRFATVNLNASVLEIRNQLLGVVNVLE